MEASDQQKRNAPPNGSAFLLPYMVSPVGFEPTTNGLKESIGGVYYVSPMKLGSTLFPW